MRALEGIVKVVREKGASDLHLVTGAPPILRVDGEIVRVDMEPITDEAARKLLFEIMSEDDRKVFEAKKDVDFAYEVPGVCRLRCNVFLQSDGIAAVFRIIPNQIFTTEQLGLPDEVLDFTKVPSGLVLVTGPTGCGKSSTLAAIIDVINRTQKKHIITIEDPIEFTHANRESLVNQREVGRHTDSFFSGLRAALREDPDIILVGEIRDLETVRLAVTAAETGQLVFGTLHTRSAAQTIDRIIDIFPDEAQAQIRTTLSETLVGTISQQLIKRKDRPGRIPAVEILKVNRAISSYIREGRSHQIPSAMQTGRREGMITMESFVQQLEAEGKIAPLKHGRDGQGPSAGQASTPSAKRTAATK